jgi:cation transport regulator ChaC
MTERITLLPGEAALFGYGSLLSRASLESTLGRKYDGPFAVAHVPGWRRTWDVVMPNQRFCADTPEGAVTPATILYLNVSRVPGSLLNGVLFVVRLSELNAYDRREWMYNRVDITEQLDVRVDGGKAYLYEARDEWRRTGIRSYKDAAVRASYLAIVESGLRDLGDGFRRQYVASTDDPPAHLVIQDRPL